MNLIDGLFGGSDPSMSEIHSEVLANAERQDAMIYWRVDVINRFIALEERIKKLEAERVITGGEKDESA